MITIDKAKTLRVGDTLYHVFNRNYDGTPQRWRVNGRPKVWKTRPKEVRVALKHGMYRYGYITHGDLDLFCLTEDEAIKEKNKVMKRLAKDREEAREKGRLLSTIKVGSMK